MLPDIKFQPVFKKFTGGFVIGDPWGLINDQYYAPGSIPDGEIHCHRYFTGMYAKGIAIYTGDKLTVDNTTCEVIFDRGAYLVKWALTSSMPLHTFLFLKEEDNVEITGNIYTD